MAFGAGHLFVHAAQRITRAVVIELGIRPDRLPTCVGMAVLARHGDGSVRIGYFGLRAAHTGSRAVRGLLYRSSSEQGYQSNQNRKEPARTYHRPLRVIQGPAPGCDFGSSPFAYKNAGLPKDPWTAVKGSTSLARAVEVSQLARCKFTDSRASRKLSRRYLFYRKLFCTALSAFNWLNKGARLSSYGAFSPEVFGYRQPVSQNNSLSKSTNFGELCEPSHLSTDSDSDYIRP